MTDYNKDLFDTCIDYLNELYFSIIGEDPLSSADRGFSDIIAGCIESFKEYGNNPKAKTIDNQKPEFAPTPFIATNSGMKCPANGNPKNSSKRDSVSTDYNIISDSLKDDDSGVEVEIITIKDPMGDTVHTVIITKVYTLDDNNTRTIIDSSIKYI